MSFSLLATTAMTGSLTAALLSPVYGLPSGGQVVGGQASINTVGSQTTITQTTNRGIINWHGFDIAHGEQVHFQQPSTSSVTLNRVTGGGGASQIMGQLSATGTVMLVNPNGVLFGPNAQVNVGSLVATSSDIADDRFMAGDYRFDMPGKSDAAIINQGNISVADAGLVAFVAPNAVNDGIIQAKLGKVQLASGDRFTLDLYGDGLVSLEAGPEITSQLVSNSGTISADGGRVFLTAAAAHDMVNSVINMDGIIQAASIGEVNGEIVIFAEGSNAVTGNDPAKKGQKQGNSTVLVSGTLNASGRNHGELGGTIEVLADRVGILSGALLDASGDAGGGTIHVGGDYLGTGDTPTALRTVVQSETLIQANATGSGNGGRVIVWSDERTDFAGRIEARGGELGGDGGFVETSGKQILNATGLVDASSPWGLAGLWLLDPNNVTIQSSGSDTNVTGNPDFTTTNDSAIVTTSSIQTALNAGTNVTVTTGTAGTDAQDGNITINSSINKTAGGEATLTLRAHNNITVSSGVNIISISDRLHLVLNSDIDGSQSGSISLLGTGTITTNGGNIIMGGGADPSTNAAYGNSTQVSGVFIQKAMHAGGGNIALRGIGWADNPTNSLGVRVGVVSTVGSGNITLVGSGGGTQIGGNGGNGVQVSGAVTAVDGVIQIIGDASSSLGNGNFAVLISNSVSTTGAGSIQVEGTGGGTTHTNYGVLVRGASASISAQGSGSVSVAGVGGTGSGNGNQGVRIANGGTITSVDGTLTVEGTGGGTGTGTHNSGVVIVDTGSAIRTTGSGNIAVTGIRGGGDTASNYGLNVSPANGIQSTGSGSIAINADTLLLASANNINSVSNLTIAPYTAGTTVGIGTGTGTLSLSNTFLGYLNWGSDKLLTFGDVNTGGMNINTSVVFANPVAFVTGSAGDIVLNGTLSSSVASGTSLVLASGKNFINNAGAAALDPGSGRWLVYSTSPANDTLGGLTSDATVYSATFSGYPPASVSESGNVFLYSSASPSGTVTITALDQFIVYGTAPDSTAVLGTTFSFSCSDGCSSSVITAGPAFAFTGGSGTGGSGNYNAGSWTITPSGVTVNNGYTINYLTGTLTVTPLAITVDGVTAVGKVYDGTTAATLSTGSASLSGVVAGDTVNLGTGSATGSFADKNVGTGKAVAASGFAISGADSGNYTLDQPAGLTADITAKQLTASVTADNKVYDGTTATTGSVGSLNGIIAGDTVNLTGTDSYDFADKNVGSGKTVMVSGLSLDGADAGNYILAALTGTADITAKLLSILGVTASNKVYDGSTAASLDTGSASLAGVVGGDTVGLETGSVSGSFADKNVGTGKAVAASGFAISGADSGNYTLDQPAGLTADITAKQLTASVTADNKVYDGTTATTGSVGSLNGIIAGDTVNLTGTDSYDFADKNVGSGKTVMVSGLSLDGADAGNYILAALTGTADITAKLLSILGVTASNKVYDGSTAASLDTGSASLSGVVAGDTVNLGTGSATGSFADKNVGTGKAVAASGFAISGADSGNYTLDQPAGLTADITAKTAIASLVGVISKTFDGSTQANVAQANYTLNGILLADSVTLNFPAIGNYATPDVGTGKLVSVMGLALLGSDALNYTLSATSISGSIGRIDPAPGPITTTDGSYADVPRLIFSNDRVINLRSSNSTVQTEQQAMHSGQSNGTLTPHELSPSSSSYKRPPRRIPYITVTPELQRELGLPQEL